MQDYYPLTAAQNMHHQWILNYKTQQVSGVSVVASLKAQLDFGLLKKCIQCEIERYGCMRVRFTKPDDDGKAAGGIQRILYPHGPQAYRFLRDGGNDQ